VVSVISDDRVPGVTTAYGSVSCFEVTVIAVCTCIYREFRIGLPQELLRPDDLVVVTDAEPELVLKLSGVWKDGLKKV